MALTYNLTGFQQDWESNQAWNWEGYNQTMSFIEETFRPWGIKLTNSIDSHPACEQGGGDSNLTDAMCDPAYHHQPWASVLTDMGSYNPFTNCKIQSNSNCGPEGNAARLAWEKNGTRGSCDNDFGRNDPNIITFCGFEGQTMNLLTSPVAKIHSSQLAPALWIGDCFPNGTSHTEWTAETMRSFLHFLDGQNITRLGIWPTGMSGGQQDGMPDIPPQGLKQSCPWMLDGAFCDFLDSLCVLWLALTC